MKNLTTKKMAVISLTAAIYAVLTVISPIPQYGEVQLRFSEALTLLAFLNPIFGPGIVLGCFIANLFSTVNPVLDSIFGTLHSAVAVFFIVKFSKNMFIASLWPTLFCFIIGGMIVYSIDMWFDLTAFLSITGFVMIGQFIAVTVIGYPIFKLLTKNERFMRLVKEL
jgi:uncharacterized membrane protein